MPRELPKKVLHVMNSAVGGAAESTLELIRQLRADYGIEACAICDLGGSDADRQRVRDAVNGEVVFRKLYWWNRKIRAKLWKRPLIEAYLQLKTGFRRTSLRDTSNAVIRFGADLIHSNTILTLEGGEAARRLRMPHVWHLRELVGPSEPFRFYRHGRRWGKFVMRRASVLIANSQRSAACVRDWLASEFLVTVPNGIDVAAYQSRQRTGSATPLIVGMIGNLTSPVKRHDWFIETAARVDRQLPIEFRLYGHDPSNGGRQRGVAYVDDLYDRVARYGLGGRVKFMGFAHDPAPELDIMLHTSPKESFGRIVVEAMACAIPVIGVRDGGVGEIVIDGETGILAEPEDIDGLARAVERLAADANLRRQMGLAGLERAQQHYSLRACAARVADVYRTAMTRPLSR